MGLIHKNNQKAVYKIWLIFFALLFLQQGLISILSANSPPRLFGTVEFKTVLKDMPKWQRVLSAEKKNPTFTDQFHTLLPKNLAEKWQTIEKNFPSFSTQEKLKAVNMFFNQWPYRTDSSLFGLEDYWATPKEFLKKSGDCEDYAIIKFFALKYLGIPEEQMRIVVVKDTIRNLGHGVLAVYIDDNIYILDNLSNTPLSHTTIRNYQPAFSLNSQFRWAHLPVKKKK
ncbi:transglutaminase-like cysteine peptidase [Desulfovibrio litoralis]|uniref:Transglutaminase-like cysteine proteinase BTLCP n=1 Tax=Desulfovibrio litoralis DSM 11393 TaxID=1121455 RepID=A0A1M7T441_9BACT|nr:transglutaminase-like cysteine peptidase [Desulfovibrio litoralis]SHN65489.1 transglutaminase-like cysteine proteinase BTLCP [Desulfovibrio litoralis DSM 11393]